MGVLNQAGKIVEGLGQMAEGTTEAVVRADPTRSNLAIDSRDQAQAVATLTDLRIPPALREWLVPALQELQFTITTVEARVIYPPRRSLDVIQNVGGQRACLHVPQEILKNAEKMFDLTGIMSAMELRDQVVIVLSQNLESTAAVYNSIVKRQWHDLFKLEWCFVPWTQLEEIKSLSTDQKAALLPPLLRLEELMTQAQALVAPMILDEDIAKLATIFGNLALFTDEGGRAWRNFLQQAGLRDYVGGLELKGAPKFVASYLMDQFKFYGPLPEHPNDKALGLFLCATLTFNDLRPEDLAYIKQTIKKYCLAPSRTDL
jgi:Effector-associated domain 8